MNKTVKKKRKNRKRGRGTGKSGCEQRNTVGEKKEKKQVRKNT